MRNPSSSSTQLGVLAIGSTRRRSGSPVTAAFKASAATSSDAGLSVLVGSCVATFGKAQTQQQTTKKREQTSRRVWRNSCALLGHPLKAPRRFSSRTALRFVSVYQNTGSRAKKRESHLVQCDRHAGSLVSDAQARLQKLFAGRTRDAHESLALGDVGVEGQHVVEALVARLARQEPALEPRGSPLTKKNKFGAKLSGADASHNAPHGGSASVSRSRQSCQTRAHSRRTHRGRKCGRRHPAAVGWCPLPPPACFPRSRRAKFRASDRIGRRGVGVDRATPAACSMLRCSPRRHMKAS
jgi:hypothetical protein